MTTTEPSNRPIDFDTTLIQLKGGYAFLACERISDTIAVTPAINRQRLFTGRFTVTAASGYSLGYSGCIACARDAAKLLAAIDADWADPKVLTTLGDQHRDPMNRAVATLATCDCSGTCEEEHCCDTSPH